MELEEFGKNHCGTFCDEHGRYADYVAILEFLIEREILQVELDQRYRDGKTPDLMFIYDFDLQKVIDSRDQLVCSYMHHKERLTDLVDEYLNTYQAVHRWVFTTEDMCKYLIDNRSMFRDNKLTNGWLWINRQDMPITDYAIQEKQKREQKEQECKLVLRDNLRLVVITVFSTFLITSFYFRG